MVSDWIMAVLAISIASAVVTAGPKIGSALDELSRAS